MTLPRRFWRTHAVVPGVAFCIALALIEALGLDRPLSHALFFNDTTRQWLGAGQGMWWARDVIHTGGRTLVRLVALILLALWLATFFSQRLRSWRRRAGFAFLAVALSTGIVGGLKAITNVDCPWDLTEFGGDRPYVTLFADRPDSLPHAACFPGAHASSGFALIFGYFLLRGRSQRRARRALLGAIAVGVIFSIGQEARGAHFLSHDVTSAAIVWFVQLLLYAWMLAPEDSRDLRDAGLQGEQTGAPLD
ncbi:MAG TPA: phosphatase PAP2 family protein [Steroidobacteraceae bacterium]|nr:phosphatase PAP2 family protein [Steroidobacteraceae bacterium]